MVVVVVVVSSKVEGMALEFVSVVVHVVLIFGSMMDLVIVVVVVVVIGSMVTLMDSIVLMGEDGIFEFVVFVDDMVGCVGVVVLLCVVKFVDQRGGGQDFSLVVVLRQTVASIDNDCDFIYRTGFNLRVLGARIVVQRVVGFHRSK